MGSVGPDDEDDNWPSPSSKEPKEEKTAFIPKQQISDEIQIVQAIAGSRRLSNALDVMESQNSLEYIVEEILPHTGLLYLAGISGSGKTILAIQLLVDIMLHRPCMTWRPGEAATEDMKTLIFSLEMNELELGERLRHMYGNSLNDDEKKAFQERFITYAEPEPFRLWEPAQQVEFIRTIKASGATVQLIDSASVSFGEELTNQVQVNKSLDFLRMIRATFGWTQIIVCHTRKPPPGIASNPGEVTLNELFGHSGVAQSASSIIIMMEDEKQRKQTIHDQLDQRKIEKRVHIINCKARFGANGGAFVSHLSSAEAVEKGEPLMFRRNAIPIEMTEEQRRAVARKKGPDLKETMGEVDFSSFMHDDDDE